MPPFRPYVAKKLISELPTHSFHTSFVSYKGFDKAVDQHHYQNITKIRPYEIVVYINGYYRFNDENGGKGA